MKDKHLDEYILAFRSIFRDKTQHPAIRRHARHLYICLALDLPTAVTSRNRLCSELSSSELTSCGPNVPLLFEDRLRAALDDFKNSGGDIAKASFTDLLEIVQSTIDTILWDDFPRSSLKGPFCNCHCNERNRSSFPNEWWLCRYLNLDTFEKHWLFPNMLGRPRNLKRARKTFYTEARIEEFRRDVQALRFDRPQLVDLGKPPARRGELKEQSIVFFVPLEEAPHRDQGVPSEERARHVASVMGLLDSFLSKSPKESDNDGIAVIHFKPDEVIDRFYRPTIVDAIHNPAFRPGPSGSKPGVFLHGWTRIQKFGELMADQPLQTEQLGRREIIMPSRREYLPSQRLQLDQILFFNPKGK